MSDDPVKHGLVASLARPGGNLTGVNLLSNGVDGKAARAAARKLAIAALLAGCASQQRFQPPQSAAPSYERVPRPPVPGAPYTRDKEDELDTPAVR